MSEDIAADLRRADALLEVNRADDALAILSAVISAAPDNARAYCLMARCHSINGAYIEMYETASHAVTCAPNDEWGHRLQSMALRNLGRVEEAIRAAQMAVTLAPMVWQPYVNLVEALIKSPDRDQRRTAYRSARTAVQLAPTASSTHVTLGRVYMTIGERDAARACFERALSLNPNDAAAQTNLAILDLHRGRISRAGRALRAVAASHPSVATYAHNVAVTARHWYARVLDIGALACFAELLLDAFVPGTLGPILGLSAAGLFLVGTAILFRRLPKPMRTLVRRQVARPPAATVFFVLFFGLALLISSSILDSARNHEDVVATGPADAIFVGVLMAVRFRGRLTGWARPYLVRRRFRAYVLAEDAADGTGPGRRVPRPRAAMEVESTNAGPTRPEALR